MTLELHSEQPVYTVNKAVFALLQIRRMDAVEIVYFVLGAAVTDMRGHAGLYTILGHGRGSEISSCPS